MSGKNADDLLVGMVAGSRDIQGDFVILRALVDEACEAGATRALAALGLADERARRDMDELRELLGAWRDVKRSAWQTVASWVIRIILATLVVGMAYRLNLLKLLEG